ncbi:MAG: polysaccharide biosynthesis protein [Clostridiales bacterium]|nr:polysaccharide biosynthesis protein [Clostridiales bacterium]
MKRLTFIKNAFILTATSLLLRTVGMLFRVYMSNRIGAEGMGLYQLIFSIYVLASTFATSGISIAVTRLVAEESRRGARTVRRILRRAIAVSALVGVVSGLAVFLAAEPISVYWLKDVRAVPALKILSPSLLFMGISSCLRGYFIARRRVSSSTNAQLFEQAVRMAVVFILIDRFAPMGISYACGAVLAADTIAEIGSCLYMAVAYRLDKKRLEQETAGTNIPVRGILRRLLSIAVPLSAGRYLNSALRTIENLLVPGCLGKYASSREQGVAQFGMLKGMAMPILFFPSSFLTSFSTLLVPEISESAARRHTAQVERAVSRTLHVTLTVSVLISGLFVLFSRPLGLTIYGSGEVGFLIGVLAPVMPFMYLENVVEGLLKGLDQQVSSLKYSVVDSALRIALIVVLVPMQGLQGFLYVMILSNVLTSVLNLRRLLKITSMRLCWGKWILKPALAVLTAGVLTWFLQNYLIGGTLSPLATLLTGIPVTTLGYAVLLLFFGCITREDARFLSPRRAPEKVCPNPRQP